MSKVVVVGGGQAAASLVARLRSKGFDGQITLIGEEPVPPYQRPPLSKAYLMGEMEEERLYLRPHSYYAEHDIDLHLNAHVSGIDPETKTVMAEGQAIAYDHLALCTGSVPRRLPAAIGGDLDGLYEVRTLKDVDAMCPSCVSGKKVLVVGGGYIGLEAAAVCAKLGLSVTLVEAADRILQRVAAPETSAWFRDLHKSHGVDLREGTGLKQLHGNDDGHVTQAELADGSLVDVDMVIVGVGISPAQSLAESAGLEILNGIAVNTQGQTSDPSIWAAGDCASFPHGEGRIRLESVGNAVDMGELVADNIMGAGRDYVAKPWFWSDQYDVKLQIAGLNTGYDRVVVRTTGDAVSHWYYEGDKLLAVDAMNDGRAYMVGKRLIDAGKSPDPDAVANPDVELKALLKA
ncbi:3-phenylpropionate/trans-cinnamate dioxygenase ferredoxin reductase subunit [Sagittula marina]|uniref:3-phenylpropionate/trans-cinnamate dioxygenase ferredoxin reductase subunit n=1 Tax=Sagittula marina TaxID=943940 RepID=A0A7W6DJ84_9RHOB|nr:FAD/NAD(P)-binding oxidoreductase [Sagittula marina]MBB3984261.1 3-phenylpropionate/trans-cinnamate dioxygenase ferredoxin reductase subunit [Sagittula marina]